ncbi:MAG TPA: hypothetical protein VHZ97_18420 [Pseudonocardiaceae bacterium]|nr:hypothetical protein [Pseudonocardiaceae bacterium]
MTLAQYLEDYFQRYEKAGDNSSSWKFERQQTFREPDDDSWREFDQGNWARSLEVFEQRRPQLLTEAREDSDRGIQLYRVRIVAEPISPYLLWELNALKVRAECGEKIRVVDAGLIEEFESAGDLPEILTLGPDTVYQVLYNEAGELDGAICSTDRADVERWVSFIAELYEKGEDIQAYFGRRVAGRTPADLA